jgi:hypothetical protein
VILSLWEAKKERKQALVAEEKIYIPKDSRSLRVEAKI